MVVVRPSRRRRTTQSTARGLAVTASSTSDQRGGPDAGSANHADLVPVLAEADDVRAPDEQVAGDQHGGEPQGRDHHHDDRRQV